MTHTATANKLFSSHMTFYELNQDTLLVARERFKEYQDANVISPDTQFHHTIWLTTNEYQNIGFYFDFNKFGYKSFESILQVSLSVFTDYVKCYLLSLFGKYALTSIANVLLDIKRLIRSGLYSILNAETPVKLHAPWLCSDFFSLLPNYENTLMDDLLASFDIYTEIAIANHKSSKRMLADFETYFRFNDILQDYWQNPLPESERLFYFPLYIWWSLTAVLPLRPREFLLTQRDCLFKDKKEHCYIKIRRNHIKGKNSGISYKIDSDYTTNTYQIPSSLWNQIHDYIVMTDEFQNTELNTLFITDTHYKKWQQKKHCNSRYFTYTNMNTLLHYFYEEIIHDKYGLNIIYQKDSNHLNPNEIRYIHLGDTRHLALINLMQEGGTPVTAMLLAGHTNDEMAANYYSNLTTLIECKTYREYRKTISGDSQYTVNLSPIRQYHTEGTPLSDGGICYSEKYKISDFSDCVNTFGEQMELGYCPSCSYYRKKGISYFNSDDIYKRRIEHDVSTLVLAVETVRKEKGNTEDIGEALLRLQSSSKSYQNYLLEKHYHERKEY